MAVGTDIAWASDLITKTGAFIVSWANYVALWLVTAAFLLAGLLVAIHLVAGAVNKLTD